MSHYLVFADAGVKSNADRSANLGYGSFLLRTSDGREARGTLDLGETTCNVAEYRVQIAALCTLAARIRATGHNPKCYTVTCHTDSRLVVDQVNGKAKCRTARTVAACTHLHEALEYFADWAVVWVPRDTNVQLFGH